MQINIRASFIAFLAVVVAAGWFAYDTFVPRLSSVSTTAVDSTEVPVVMPTAGGLLEIASVKVTERFNRQDPLKFGNKWLGEISLGTTISEIQVAVTYRYYIEMLKAWPITIKGKACIVHANELKPAVPVAFDSSTVQKYTKSGWARFNKSENLLLLERSMTPELAARAPRYRPLATEAGRRTVVEFVTTWLLKEQHWQRNPEYQVVVLFPGETMPKSIHP